jgi:hypothetical protein
VLNIPPTKIGLKETFKLCSFARLEIALKDKYVQGLEQSKKNSI